MAAVIEALAELLFPTLCLSCGSVMTEPQDLSLIHIFEPTRLLSISYAVFCVKKKNTHTPTS